MAHRPDRTGRRSDAVNYDIVDENTHEVIQQLAGTDRRKVLRMRDTLSQQPKYSARRLKVVPHVPEATKPHRPPTANFQRQMGDGDRHPAQRT